MKICFWVLVHRPEQLRSRRSKVRSDRKIHPNKCLVASCDTGQGCVVFVFYNAPVWLLRFTVVSRMVTFPDCFFHGKTFPGWSFSRMTMRRFPERLREWYA